MTTVKANRQGELVLSKELLEAHGIPEGAEVEITGGRKEIVLRPVEADHPAPEQGTLTIEEFLAKLPRIKGPPVTDEMIREAIDAEAIRKWDEENSR